MFSSERVKLISDMAKNESLFKSFQKHFSKQYDPKEHLGFTLSQGFCDHLTLEQMDLLATLHPKIREDEVYIGCYFQKFFSEELSDSNQEIWTHEEKRSNLLRLYTYAKSKKLPKTL